MAVVQPPKGHDPLYSGLLLFGILARLLLGFLASRLSRCARLELSCNALQIEWHFRICFEEEELEVSGLVLELDLSAILQYLRYAALGTKQRQNLTPVRPLHHVETRHERLFFLGAPWPSRRV